MLIRSKLPSRAEKSSFVVKPAHPKDVIDPTESVSTEKLWGFSDPPKAMREVDLPPPEPTPPMADLAPAEDKDLEPDGQTKQKDEEVKQEKKSLVAEDRVTSMRSKKVKKLSEAKRGVTLFAFESIVPPIDHPDLTLDNSTSSGPAVPSSQCEEPPPKDSRLETPLPKHENFPSVEDDWAFGGMTKKKVTNKKKAVAPYEGETPTLPEDEILDIVNEAEGKKVEKAELTPLNNETSLPLEDDGGWGSFGVKKSKKEKKKGSTSPLIETALPLEGNEEWNFSAKKSAKKGKKKPTLPITESPSHLENVCWCSNTKIDSKGWEVDPLEIAKSSPVEDTWGQWGNMSKKKGVKKEKTKTDGLSWAEMETCSPEDGWASFIPRMTTKKKEKSDGLSWDERETCPPKEDEWGSWGIGKKTKKEKTEVKDPTSPKIEDEWGSFAPMKTKEKIKIHDPNSPKPEDPFSLEDDWGSFRSTKGKKKKKGGAVSALAELMTPRPPTPPTSWANSEGKPKADPPVSSPPPFSSPSKYDSNLGDDTDCSKVWCYDCHSPIRCKEWKGCARCRKCIPCVCNGEEKGEEGKEAEAEDAGW